MRCLFWSFLLSFLTTTGFASLGTPTKARTWWINILVVIFFNAYTPCELVLGLGSRGDSLVREGNGVQRTSWVSVRDGMAPTLTHAEEATSVSFIQSHNGSLLVK